jgi:Cysteine rich repeat
MAALRMGVDAGCMKEPVSSTQPGIFAVSWAASTENHRPSMAVDLDSVRRRQRDPAGLPQRLPDLFRERADRRLGGAGVPQRERTEPLRAVPASGGTVGGAAPAPQRQAPAAAAPGTPAPTATAPATPAYRSPPPSQRTEASPRQEVYLLRRACGPDYRALCSDVPVGGGRVIECLRANGRSLSRPCRSALGSATRGH